jgi:hypothetical protein
MVTGSFGGWIIWWCGDLQTEPLGRGCEIADAEVEVSTTVRCLSKKVSLPYAHAYMPLAFAFEHQHEHDDSHASTSMIHEIIIQLDCRSLILAVTPRLARGQLMIGGANGTSA